MSNDNQPPEIPGLSHAYALRALLAGRNNHIRQLMPELIQAYPDAWNNELWADALDLGIIGYVLRYTLKHEPDVVPDEAREALASIELPPVLYSDNTGKAKTAYLVYDPQCKASIRARAVERLKLALGKAGRN